MHRPMVNRPSILCFAVCFPRYGLGSVGYCLLILCVSVQWSMIVESLVNGTVLHVSFANLMLLDKTASIIIIFWSVCDSMCILKVSGPEKDFKTCKIIKRLRCRTFFNACITWRSLCGPYGGLLKLAAPGNQGLLAPSKEFNILSEESDGCGKKENRYIYIYHSI